MSDQRQNDAADQQQNGDSNALTDIEIERLKTYQDSFKHMMTFCSGGILLSSAVTGALIPKPVYVVLLAISIILLVIGAAATMIGLVHGSAYMDLAAEGRPKPPKQLHRYLWLSVGSAYFALAFFALFAITNLAPELLGG